MPTPTRVPYRISTPTRAATAMAPSTRSSRQMRRTPRRSMKRSADASTTAPRAGMGSVGERAGSRITQDRAATVSAATMPVSCVVEPAASAAEVRDGLERDRVAAGQAGPEVGHRQGHELAVRRRLLAMAGGEAAPGQDRVGEAQDGDADRARAAASIASSTDTSGSPTGGRPGGTGPRTCIPPACRSSTDAGHERHDERRAARSASPGSRGRRPGSPRRHGAADEERRHVDRGAAPRATPTALDERAAAHAGQVRAASCTDTNVGERRWPRGSWGSGPMATLMPTPVM